MTQETAPLSVQRSGTGPPIVLVHGGLPAPMEWAAQQELAGRWSLIVPSRRGFPPSPAAPWQDFLVDTDDLAQLVVDVPGGVHLVGYSYGGVSACLTAEAVPQHLRSLTLIETPLWHAAEDDPAVREMADISDRFAADADDAEAERAFFAMISVDPAALADLGEEVRPAVELARKLRSPREAKPRFETICAAGVPALVISGDHHPGHERLCDAIATQLGAQRARVPGAGHAVQFAPGFNTTLETFLTAAESRRGTGGVVHE